MKPLELNLQRKMRRRGRSTAPKQEEEEEEEQEQEEVVYIPTHLHADILQWLPSDCLLNFKLVSKEWNRLISSPEFIEKHLERSKARCSNPRILVPLERQIRIIDHERCIITKKVYCDNQLCLLGSCDGLVLLHKPYGSTIGALNPATGKYEERKPSRSSLCRDLRSRTLISTWFGRHPSTGEYVLVLSHECMIEESNHIIFKVYSLSRGSLLSSSTTKVDTGRSYRSCQIVGTLLHGRLHCIITSISFTCFQNLDPDFGNPFSPEYQNLVLVYDFQTNEVERMRQPPALVGWNTLGVVDGCLWAMCVCGEWMMKEYGVEESWTKYDPDCKRYWSSLCACGNADVILNNSWFLKLRKKQYSEARDSFKLGRGGPMELITPLACLDSLLSPALVWTQN